MGRGSRCCCCLKRKKIERIKGCKKEIKDKRRGETRVHEMTKKDKKQSTIVPTKATPKFPHRRDIQGVDGGGKVQIVDRSDAAPDNRVVTCQVPKGAGR